MATVAAFVAIPATWKLINFGKGFGAAAEQIRRPFSTAFVVARDSTALCTKLISFSVRRPICRHMVGDEVSSSARFFGNCLHFFLQSKAPFCIFFAVVSPMTQRERAFHATAQLIRLWKRRKVKYGFATQLFEMHFISKLFSCRFEQEKENFPFAFLGKLRECSNVKFELAVQLQKFGLNLLPIIVCH